MANYTFNPTHFCRTFGEKSPAFTLKPGDKVTITTLDAHGFDKKGIRRVEFSNPLVGPFFVEGLEPGDTLSVFLERIILNRTHGWSHSTPLPTTVEHDYVENIPARQIIDWTIDPAKNTARLKSPIDGFSELVIQCHPMLGCIGVAPELDQAITSYSSGNFGGNMDCPLITGGCRIDLPVFVKGGLLYLGDCHATQCDGEITGGAIEVPGEVTFRVEILKQKKIRWPHGENDTIIFTTGSGRPLDQALQYATSEMHRRLVKDYHLTETAAGILMSQIIQYKICNVVSPHFTAACILPKNILNTIR